MMIEITTNAHKKQIMWYEPEKLSECSELDCRLCVRREDGCLKY